MATTPRIRPDADAGSATLGFHTGCQKVLKSEHLGQRRRLIKHLRADIRHCAVNKSVWLALRRLLNLVSLRLLECEMRLQKLAARKSFVAVTHMQAIGSANDHVR